MSTVSVGLEDVEVAETRLSSVDGLKGELVVAGRSLPELAALSFEEAAQLLWERPVDFGAYRVEVYRRIQPLLSQLGARSPIEAMRLGLAALPTDAPQAQLVAAFPILLAAANHGEGLLQPDPKLAQVEDLLRLFHGRTADSSEVKALSTYLVTVAEHGMNASTFCCRVTASTQAQPAEAALAAFCALCGPLHGGAPGPVLDLLDELAQASDPRAVLEHKVTAGERLMGFGHRVYKTRDPRAEVLRSAVRGLRPSATLVHAETVEQVATEVLSALKPGRNLYTNVEFYTAVLLNELGFPRQYFTPLFATGRILGWMAHYDEQRKTGRLMRPKARYVGPSPV